MNHKKIAKEGFLNLGMLIFAITASQIKLCRNWTVSFLRNLSDVFVDIGRYIKPIMYDRYEVTEIRHEDAAAATFIFILVSYGIIRYISSFFIEEKK
jgi:hypothetical protein